LAKFLIVEARFYEHLNDQLIAGARAALKAAGHKADVVTVPGALEIPAAIALADQDGSYDGYVAIGVVIRGETYHFEIVAGESARGIMALTMDGLPIGNGILTVENAGPGSRRSGAEGQGRRSGQGGPGALRTQEEVGRLIAP
jgi:6,7-dimethyl-8-ribityllumazine synthase